MGWTEQLLMAPNDGEHFEAGQTVHLSVQLDFWPKRLMLQAAGADNWCVEKIDLSTINAHNIMPSTYKTKSANNVINIVDQSVSGTIRGHKFWIARREVLGNSGPIEGHQLQFIFDVPQPDESSECETDM